jgi:hypothetical protein
MVYVPKASGVLRPLTLLCIADQIVYQALVNVIASLFQADQAKLADKRAFGAIYSGDGVPFFYRHWKQSYQSFTHELRSVLSAGNRYCSEFDLVSCYELIDHGLLRSVLEKRIRSDQFLDLLFACLAQWTTNDSGDLRHGLPQGPISSAFIAECFLFPFDRLKLKDVAYLRYVDDIRLLASRPEPIRRGLIRLDLSSKTMGLVPQAQKITAPRKVSSVSEIIKTLPSMFAAPTRSSVSQQHLRRLFKGSVAYKAKKWRIENGTHFKFALNRMKPTKAVLRRLFAIAKEYPDYSATIAAYLLKFGIDSDVYDGALSLLAGGLVYDAANISFISVLISSGLGRKPKSTLVALKSVRNGTAERSGVLRLALAEVLSRQRGPAWLIAFVRRELTRHDDTIVITTLLHRLVVDQGGVFTASAIRGLLADLTLHKNEDVSRFATAVILTQGSPAWIPKKGTPAAANILLHSLGLRRSAPRKSSTLQVFFREKMGIAVDISWRKALGAALPLVEQRCIRMQQLANGDQTARILIVDTFNDLLLQHFCPTHPLLKGAYSAAKGRKHHPDLGAWLGQADLSTVTPVAAAWFKLVHDKRVLLDLSHATAKSGAPTAPIKRKDAEVLLKGSRAAWLELLRGWKPLL